MIENSLSFIAILAPLIIFHEFGHYILARIFNVKAEVFSVGFGPKLLSKTWGETEWKICAIPLGGYVKLLGEEPGTELPPELKKRSFQGQDPWKRFLIYLAGPAFNFILAFFVFMLVLVYGERKRANVVERVVEFSTAYQAGFRSGDQILSVNSTPTDIFDDVKRAIENRPNEELKFTVIHQGEDSPVELSVRTSSVDGYSMYGEEGKVGSVDGFELFALSTMVGISDPKSPAYASGLRTGDRLVKFNGEPIRSWMEFERQVKTVAPGGHFQLDVLRGDGTTFEVRLATKTRATKADTNMASEIGLHPSELFVDEVIKDSAAARAGIQAGDRLVQVGDKVVHSFDQLRQAIQSQGRTQDQVMMTWERSGSLMKQAFIPDKNDERDILLNKTVRVSIGVRPKLDIVPEAQKISRIFNPIRLVAEAAERTYFYTHHTLITFWKIFNGQVTLKTLGGPILMFKLAGHSIERGVDFFLSTMAMLSISLGIINLLPVPVLDGGGLLLLGIEAVRRRPLTVRQLEIAHQLGLAFIVGLMILVFTNDLMRISVF